MISATLAAPPSPPLDARAKRPPPDVVPGTRLGKYEIVRRIATGGMAEIFLARVSGLPGFQKNVVVKRILPQLATKADFIEMFLDEARIAATLQHPNVVQMYDVGVVDGNYFIAMEYLNGEDVRTVMKTLFRKDGKLPLEFALGIVIGVASGLHYAHEKKGFDGKPLQIIHRDVTPQNVIITYEGGVKLLDFGIAKATNRFGETRFGTLKGKVPYMSPEQCRGEPLDRRSDMFSLGIMLYELTLGRRLFRGRSDFEILKQIVEGTVSPPRSIDPTYPVPIERIVMRALEKEREKRYQTAQELQADLEWVVREERVNVSPIALAKFMEQTFGGQAEAEARHEAQGERKTEEEALEDEDIEVINEEQAQAEERAREERAAMIAQIHSRSDSESQSLRQPARSRLPLVMVCVGALALGIVAAWKLTARPKAKPAPVGEQPVSPLVPVSPPTNIEPPELERPPAPVAVPPAQPAAQPVKPAHGKHGSKPAKPLKPVEVKPVVEPKLEGDGTLVIASTPWCNVSVDGDDKGPTPLKLTLPAGKHTVVLSNPEFKITRSLSIMIQPGETLRKKLDFDQ